MKDAVKNSDASNDQQEGSWDWFWFSAQEVGPVSLIRGLLSLISLIYFVSAWTDTSFWYVNGGPLSVNRVSEFLRTGGLEGAGRWIISPLFLTELSWVYHLYLVAAIATSLAVFCGRGGRVASFLLWFLLVGWANRTMLLSGLAETLLSLGLFAAAIAPSGRTWEGLVAKRFNAAEKIRGSLARHWTAGFAERLLATQITVIGLATWVTMLGGRVWFNGLGAYALAAPVQDRTINWTTSNSWLVRTPVHEMLTHWMVFALPLGFLLAWLPRTSQVGKLVLFGWCGAVALLGSHWLYAMTFAVMVVAIRPLSQRHRRMDGVPTA